LCQVRYVTKVLAKNCDAIDNNTKKDLICDFKARLINFRIHAPNISSAYHCLAKMLDAVGEEAKGQKLLQDFGKEILHCCRIRIREVLLEIEEQQSAEKLSDRETLLIRMITTIGEVVQFSSQLMKSALRLFDALKTVLASDLYNETELSIINSAMPSVNPTPSISRAPSPAMSLMSMEGGHSQPTSTSSQPLSSQGGTVIPQHIVQDAINGRRALLTPPVRAYAVLTIGKFCLMDEKIAKSTIPVFVKQLKLNPDHVIRNNIALVVCDLCIRYTLMVDRYTPIIAACLKDRSTLVRQQTLESLTSLIKEQFIRWEGQIMYRFVSTILDENKVISEYAKFCLVSTCFSAFKNNSFLLTKIFQRDVLLLQFPDLFESHFIECLMYFNNVPIMSLKEIKLNMDVGKGPDEEEEPPAALVAVAKEIVTKAFRKAMLEYVMPALLDLRVYLNEKRSALRKDLYAIFRVICREHKEQMDEFLDGDEQLKSEVEYDICRYEARERAERAAAKKRAERAATERRLSRRSLAVTRQINDDELSVNETQQNTSAVKTDGTAEQEPPAQGTEHPHLERDVPMEVDDVASTGSQCVASHEGVNSLESDTARIIPPISFESEPAVANAEGWQN
ncbi:HEAT repeat protein, partial [Oesophagostomum dentatum]